MKKPILITIVFLNLISFIMAQENIITGTVYSFSTKEAIPFVNIIAEGSQQGTTTDMDGKYSIEAPYNSTRLIFSFVGYKMDTINIDGRTQIDVYLHETHEMLDEVVVTALGIKREKKALGYAMQKVSGEELQVTKDPSVINQLAGKVAGLQINSTNSGSGSSSRLVLRGTILFWAIIMPSLL